MDLAHALWTSGGWFRHVNEEQMGWVVSGMSITLYNHEDQHQPGMVSSNASAVTGLQQHTNLLAHVRGVAYIAWFCMQEEERPDPPQLMMKRMVCSQIIPHNWWHKLCVQPCGVGLYSRSLAHQIQQQAHTQQP